jgi:hypothetical protein
VLCLFRRNLTIRHGDPGERRELTDGVRKIDPGRLRPPVHEVEKADKAPTLDDEAPVAVAVAMDTFRSRLPRKRARGVSGCFPPIAPAPEAVFGKGGVQTAEEGRIDRSIEEVIQVRRHEPRPLDSHGEAKLILLVYV